MTPRTGGLWSRVKDADGYIDPAAWDTAVGTRQHVGTCTVAQCGGQLQPGRPDTGDRRVTWYPARCVNADCGHVIYGRSPRPAKSKG